MMCHEDMNELYQMWKRIRNEEYTIKKGSYVAATKILDLLPEKMDVHMRTI